jgi:hypothetical protein
VLLVIGAAVFAGCLLQMRRMLGVPA